MEGGPDEAEGGQPSVDKAKDNSNSNNNKMSIPAWLRTAGRYIWTHIGPASDVARTLTCATHPAKPPQSRTHAQPEAVAASRHPPGTGAATFSKPAVTAEPRSVTSSSGRAGGRGVPEILVLGAVTLAGALLGAWPAGRAQRNALADGLSIRL